jgi:hypothetical protein
MDQAGLRAISAPLAGLIGMNSTDSNSASRTKPSYRRISTPAIGSVSRSTSRRLSAARAVQFSTCRPLGVAGRHLPKAASRAVAGRRGRPYEIYRFNCTNGCDLALDHADERPLNQDRV